MFLHQIIVKVLGDSLLLNIGASDFYVLDKFQSAS